MLTTTHTLLQRLSILHTNANAPRPAQMPRRLARQVLHHDAGQHGDFCLNIRQDALVGEEKAVGYVLACPGWRVCVSGWDV
jgi:hypothetical protein